MRQTIWIVVAGGCVALSSAAWGATMQSVDGPVLANAGEGYVRIDNGASVTPGTQIMARPGASARIVYESGCEEPVQPGTVVTVQTEGLCTKPAATSAMPFLIGAAALGGAAALSIGLTRGSGPASP